MIEQLFSYEHVQKFNDTDMLLYKYILAHPSEAVFMTIRELAQATHVSTSSILRFCEKTGCEGYTQFRIRLRESQTGPERPQPGSDVRDILAYFERTYTSAFEEMSCAAVDLILESDTVIFIGIGGSGILARYGARCFSNYGKFSLSIEDPYYPILRSLGNRVLIIALSVTGESQLLVEQLKDCRQLHYRLLSITNEPDSTIAKMSDFNLSYQMPLRRDSRNSNMTTQVPVLFLIEALARRWAESAARV